MKVKCNKCGVEKTPHDFYKNNKKLNGLESHCKACVLKRKGKRYESLTKAKRKTKQLRLHKKVNVLDVEECTLSEHLIIRPTQSDVNDLLKEFVSGVLCYQDIQNLSA